MILRAAETALGGARTVIQIGACSLIGVMMVFAAGLPLLIGGRPEALVPLGLGTMAFLRAANLIRGLKK